MKKLGISIYPDKADEKEVKDYIDLASKYGFTRIFSCLLSAEEDKQEIVKKFKNINSYAKSKGFEIIVDVAPNIFPKLGASYTDLSFFKEILADGLRLDVGYTGNEEALMTFNEQGLIIEINMSNDTHYVDTIMDFIPNKNKLYGCHNFYPHKYFGLGIEYFMKCTENFTKYGLNTAAFISSGVDNSFGPWLVREGLPTLEMHRNMPIDVQFKHYLAMGNIDDIIISNCYASEDEFKSIASLRRDMLTFDIKFVDNIPGVEKKIVLEEQHYNRGDKNEYAIRSTQSRVKYKKHNFLLFNPKDNIEIGDVIIESAEYGHYAGELQIATKPMKNSGKSNVIGSISQDEIFLLDYIKPWQKFAFRQR